MNNYFGPHVADAGLGKQTVHGGALTMIGRGARSFVQLAQILFLARLLSPEEYGLVAMVTAVTGFAQIIVDLGTRDAIVQRDTISEEEVSALFWINLGVGFALAGLIAACGPAIAAFYHEPRLTGLVFVSATTFILAALGSQHEALLRRVGRFRETAMVETVATILSVVITIVMAYVGLGYWALAARPVGLFAFLSLGYWWRAKWIPGIPSFTAGVNEMIRFGVNLMGYSISEYVGRGSQRVAIGKGLGPAVLGYYQNALVIYDNVMDLMISSLHSVAVSGLSKLRHQPENFKRSWANALSTLSFYSMPVYGLLAVTGQDLVVVLLGKKWANAGLLLSIIALRGIPHTVEKSTGWLYVTAGRTDRWMRWGVFSTFVQLAALLCAVAFGTVWVAAAYTISMFLLVAPAANYAGRPLGIGFQDVMRAVWRQAASALLASGIGFYLRFRVLEQSGGLLRSAVLTVSFVAIYFLFSVGILGLRKPLHVTVSMLRGFVPKRFASAAAAAQ